MYPDFRPDPYLEPPQGRPADTPLETIIRRARDSGPHLDAVEPSQGQQPPQGPPWSRGLDVLILSVFALLFLVVIVKSLAGASTTPSVTTSPSQQPSNPAPQAPEGAGVTAPSIPRPTQPQEKPRAAPTLGGTWEGTYRCSQGTTGLRLLVRTGPADSLQATFVFYPIPSNPSVPSGSFEMTGSSSSSRVTLQQSHWIKAPPGYEMVDLSGTVSDDSSRLEGTVISDTPGCTTFLVMKAL